MEKEENLVKLRNRGNYFIPNMENKSIHGIDQYGVTDNPVMLSYILEHTSKSILELMRQYPMALDEEEIQRLMAIQNKTAKSLACNPKFCYQYFGCEGSIYQGINIEQGMDDHVVVQLTLNNCIQNPSYQRRVELDYDLEAECYVPCSLVELERKNDCIIQKEFSPKILRKTRKYIWY